MNKPFRTIAADHTGITVSNLERALGFWRDVLGFEFSHRAHQTGELASEITGVPGAEISLAVLTGYGHTRSNCSNTSRQPTGNNMPALDRAMLDRCTLLLRSIISTGC